MRPERFELRLVGGEDDNFSNPDFSTLGTTSTPFNNPELSPVRKFCFENEGAHWEMRPEHLANVKPAREHLACVIRRTEVGSSSTPTSVKVGDDKCFTWWSWATWSYPNLKPEG
jgi:hypothetical protein